VDTIQSYTSQDDAPQVDPLAFALQLLGVVPLLPHDLLPSVTGKIVRQVDVHADEIEHQLAGSSVMSYWTRMLPSGCSWGSSMSSGLTAWAMSSSLWSSPGK